MNEADALDIMRTAVWTILIASGPAVLAAMIVGITVALIQALTQVQEMTLTFVPKILAILITIGITAPFVGAQISLFANLVFSRVQTGF
ncbi:flagellar biosynthetic protein FliQ [Agrobacterium vitis]|uniref:Flagellar biosynthetic protein FliQ n=1 Tax=Rhizobium oryziradicis TaxID=1867956 RepID=A0A1Q8ZUR5_9HYPH|nr:flagellar biosynthesis protein FliQ [Rhizobium oryziradicis]MBB4953942.1 flagellar biosynthetic protein FliQ [Agrobacterium vitis]MBE1438257.1 flagellar biosynthetic protein FliQ [Agrobacterium vitis]OLP45801.1 flagellar biosynthetic protein FliQ [Rhizobium oryziradicis]